MRFDILTLFPEMLVSPLSASMIKLARDKGIIEINPINIRDYAADRHQTADDYPYGGGAGMVMKPDVLHKAIAAVKVPGSHLIYLSPQGRLLNQHTVRRLAAREHLILLCGHYEGIDERVMPLVDEELSIGDYVLTGGELPAMVLIDAVSRLIPGVLSCAASYEEESHSAGLLEHPHYTRPAEAAGARVPEVLLSGHHANIRRWRLQQSLRNTLLKRPELLLEKEFDPEERELLSELLFSKRGSHEHGQSQ